jgi:hypothetical protein
MMGFGASYDVDRWVKRKFYNTLFFAWRDKVELHSIQDQIQHNDLQWKT